MLTIGASGTRSLAIDTLYLEQFSTDGVPGGRYSAVRPGVGTAGAFWERTEVAFTTPAQVSAANGWKVLGDPSPFPGINLSGSITSTAYKAGAFGDMITAPSILAIETGGALNTLLPGTPAVTEAPARRVFFPAQDTATVASLTPSYLTMLDSAFTWALNGQTNKTIGFVSNNNGVSSWDASLITRLQGQGHTIVQVPQGTADPSSLSVDMFYISDAFAAGNATRWRSVAKPVINTEWAAMDDLGLGTDGTDPSTGFINITASGASHPIASGFAAGPIEISNPAQGLGRGTTAAPGAVVVASLDVAIAGTIDSLAKADALKSQSGVNPPPLAATGMKTISQADLYDKGTSPVGRWSFDNTPADPPIFQSDNYALFNTGTLSVTQAGTYYFAISGTDGGRLRIDTDNNGFSDADNVIVDDAVRSAVADAFGSKTLSPGNYNFEWVGFRDANTAAPSGYELSVALSPAVTGGPFTGASGFYWIGSDLDQNFGGGPASAADPRIVETKAISIAGVADKTTLALTMDMAAITGGWNATDFLKVLIDPDADGPAPPVLVSEFNGTTTSLSNGAVTLGPAFQNVSIPLTAVDLTSSTSIKIRIEGLSTDNAETMAFDNIQLTGTVVGLVGDYNGNGVVDAADFTVWRDGGSPDSSPAGYLAWKNNFGASLAAASVSAVPEPAAWLVLGLGAPLFAAARRRLLCK